MLPAYRQHVAERAALGIPPLPLTEAQTSELTALLAQPPAGEEKVLVDLMTHRVPAGVDDAARVKAAFLASVAAGKEKVALISREKATELLGTMLGGFNVKPLIDLLDDAQVGALGALLEAGLHPDMLVGTSIGAINSAFLALKGINLKGVLDLTHIWMAAMTVAPELMPSNYLWLSVRAMLGRVADNGDKNHTNE